MFNWLLRMFGFGKKPETEIITEQQVLPPINVTPVTGGKYYRQNGNFYAWKDHSMVEDLLVIAILVEMFDDPDYVQQEESVAEQVAEIDAAVEQVRQETVGLEVTYERPDTYRVPEPTPDYSSSSNDSSYDSGGSDSSSNYD